MNTLKEQIRNFDWSLVSITKAAVALVVIAVALAVVTGTLKYVANNVFGNSSDGYSQQREGNFVMDFAEEAMGSLSLTSKMMVSGGADSLPPFFEDGGSDAEDYERRDYNARYETRKFDETCEAIANLKPLEYVVFNNSNKNDTWCNYSFRVEIEYEDEIISVLKDLDPRDFDVNTSTIERSIEYTDSELVMLERRHESTTATLNQAETAFNQLITQATNKGDTATLSDVINNKISTIDRLTQQLLNTQDRIDRLTKGRGDKIEQIEYAHFNVSVSKVTFIDGEQIADQWRERVQEMFTKVNMTLLAVTVGLVTFLLAAVEFVIFAAIIVVGGGFLAKLAWTVLKRIWKWQPRRKSENTFEDSSRR